MLNCCFIPEVSVQTVRRERSRPLVRHSLHPDDRNGAETTALFAALEYDQVERQVPGSDDLLHLPSVRLLGFHAAV